MKAIKMKMTAALNGIFRLLALSSSRNAAYKMPGILMRFCTCVYADDLHLSAPKIHSKLNQLPSPDRTTSPTKKYFTRMMHAGSF